MSTDGSQTPATSTDPETGAEGDTDQLQNDDTLMGGGVENVLDEDFSHSPPYRQHPHELTTELEQEEGDSLSDRLDQEQPDVWQQDPAPGSRDPDRTGRLVEDDVDASHYHASDVTAEDVGVAGGDVTAEESAMHVLDDDDAGGGVTT